MKAHHVVIHFSYRVFCLLGDGEMSEGSVWEAMSFASYYQLDNLVAIMDVNRLGQSDPAPLQHHVEKYQKRCEAFGIYNRINCSSTGGLGEAVSSAMVNESGFTLHRLAVSHIPRSGKPHELLKIYGIDRDAIAQAIRKMLSSSANAK
ncbi:hypothetical protein XENOCAPTIV_007694 [Xenoophorus captivus]|uniref:Transketolase N-terminal domain-containing protein n=1 Tax=Xenoophorus captivus TaxID=1517983 RepID=A0ABV0Q9C6_9TELE